MMTMSSTGDQLKSDRCPFTGNPDRCIYELDHWYRSRWWWSWWSSSVCSPYWWSVNSYLVGIRKSNCLGFFWFPSRIQSSPSNGNTFHQSSCHCSCHWLVANLSMDFYKTPASQLLLHKALWLPQRAVFLIRVGFGLGCGKTIEIKVTKHKYFVFLLLIFWWKFSWKCENMPQLGLN